MKPMLSLRCIPRASEPLRRSLTKAALIPLIKRIHPDLFQKYGEEVCDTNKSSIQNLYELSEFLRGMESNVQRRGLNPLRPSYCLNFFLRDTESDEVVETKIEVKPNQALCEQSFLINKKLDLAVADLKGQVGDIYVKAGLLSPFGRKQNFGKVPGTDGMDIAEIDRIIYERYMDKRKNTHKISMISRLSRLEHEADDFIRGGGVLFQRMSPPDEAQALTKIRSFLVDYGTVLNLGSNSRWESLHIVITDMKDTKNEEENYKMSSSKKRRTAVVEVPKNFKDEKVLGLLAKVALKTTHEQE